jgi:hypothetical protein
MRVKDILKEASIFTREGAYTYGHKVKVSNSAKGKELTAKIQEVIPDFENNEELEWVEKASKKAPKIVYGRGEVITNFKRPNGEIFSVLGSRSTLENVLNHSGKYKRGDVAEAVLGAALAAKLTKRGSDKIGHITLDDVKRVLANTTATSDNSVAMTVEDKNSQIADVIQFNLALPSEAMLQVKNPNNFSKFDDLFSAAVHYANSTDAERYSNYFYKNGKVDEVHITSDGVSDQKGRKTDIQAVVYTTDPATGERSTRNLKNVDISLKADSAKYGQSTAGGLKQSKEQWLEAAKVLFEPLGVSVHMPKKKDMLGFYIDVYKQVATDLHHALASASANKETTFIEKIANLIKHHGAGNNQNIKLVNLEKGVSSVHSFNILQNRLVEENIDLDAKFAVGPRSGKPIIYIYDKNSLKVLTAIRFYLTAKAATSYFEKGELLHELTRLEKVKLPVAKPEQPAAVQPEQPVQQPVAPQQVPVQQEPQPEQPAQQTPDELDQIKRNAGIQQPA